jgi:hypothetical protein
MPARRDVVLGRHIPPRERVEERPGWRISRGQLDVGIDAQGRCLQAHAASAAKGCILGLCAAEPDTGTCRCAVL